MIILSLVNCITILSVLTSSFLVFQTPQRDIVQDRRTSCIAKLEALRRKSDRLKRLQAESDGTTRSKGRRGRKIVKRSQSRSPIRPTTRKNRVSVSSSSSSYDSSADSSDSDYSPPPKERTNREEWLHLPPQSGSSSGSKQSFVFGEFGWPRTSPAHG